MKQKSIDKNMEIMKKVIEKKKQKSASQKNTERPDRYGKQPAGAGNL